ncbi:MAG: aminotransferase class V-fold PLP-dependent enzyme [Patescibacteria group bacterium]
MLHIKKKLTLSQIKKYFVNPERPSSANDLAKLLSQAVLFMAEIYATEGNFSEVENKIKVEEKNDKLTKVLRQVLEAESETRLFNTRFMGQIHPQGNKIAILSKVIAGFMNNNTVVKEVSPVESQMEFFITKRVAGWFGYNKDEFSGNLTTGGTTANLEALWVARTKVLQKNPNIKKMYIFVNDMAHYSIDKAADLLGKRVEIVRTPMQGYKTDVVALQKLLQQKSAEKNSALMAIVAIAGETETGEVDDLNTMASLSKKYKTHFHVDAAYGGPFVLSREKARFKGIENADSITIDPHKMLYLSYGSGMVLFKNKKEHALIENGMRNRARYLIRKNSDRNLGMARIEGSMSSEGAISTWATIKLLGEEGLSIILNHTLDLTQYAYEQIKKYKILKSINKPELNTLLIGINTRKLSIKEYDQIIKKMHATADNMGFYISFNEKVDKGFSALRLVPMHPHTSKKDIDKLLKILKKIAEIELS